MCFGLTRCELGLEVTWVSLCWGGIRWILDLVFLFGGKGVSGLFCWVAT